MDQRVTSDDQTSDIKESQLSRKSVHVSTVLQDASKKLKVLQQAYESSSGAIIVSRPDKQVKLVLDEIFQPINEEKDKQPAI